MTTTPAAVLALDVLRHQVVTRTGPAPTVHENGFIQLPAAWPHEGRFRLHVWPAEPITQQRTRSPIHDHRFSFISQVLHGTLDHITYHWIEQPSGPYQLLTVRDGALHPVPETFGSLLIAWHDIFHAGSTYAFESTRLHESRPRGLTVTLLEKTHDRPFYPPRVIGHRDEPPDNTFRRDTAEPLVRLWAILTEVFVRGILG